MFKEQTKRQPLFPPPMSHEKAIELLAELQRNLEVLGDPDTRGALRMATVALITEKLNLEGG